MASSHLNLKKKKTSIKRIRIRVRPKGSFNSEMKGVMPNGKGETGKTTLCQ